MNVIFNAPIWYFESIWGKDIFKNTVIRITDGPVLLNYNGKECITLRDLLDELPPKFDLCIRTGSQFAVLSPNSNHPIFFGGQILSGNQFQIIMLTGFLVLKGWKKPLRKHIQLYQSMYMSEIYGNLNFHKLFKFLVKDFVNVYRKFL